MTRKTTSYANEQPNPCARLVHQVAAEQRLRCLDRGEQHGNHHRKQQQRQEHLARPAPARHGGVERPEHDEPDRAERKHAEQGRPRRGNRPPGRADPPTSTTMTSISPTNARFASSLPVKIVHRAPGYSSSGSSAPLSSSTWYERLNASTPAKKRREPQRAGRRVAERLCVGAEREAEQHEDRHAERDDAVEARPSSAAPW